MARNYSVEDVETLRQKSGVSYEEAIRLLDKYDGDLASALIELEKSGHLGKGVFYAQVNVQKISETVQKWWNLGLKNRVLIERKETTLVNLPVLAAILIALCAPRAMLAGAVLLLLLGGHISLCREEQAEPVEPPQEPAQEPQQSAPAPEEKPSDGFDRITIE